MLRKKEVYTHITPIPSHIPRQLAIDILHSHGEIITLNPLVLEYTPVKAPRDAATDEYYASWYEITERIQYVPGMGKMGSGKISFKGCFHDMPWGLQTHILAPMSIDMRNNWRICGNQPGEPPEVRELGVGAPAEGLYLREDIEIKCNITMVSIVKAQMKASSKILVERLLKKAELLDAGVLHAMMEEGKLKILNPADRTNSIANPPMSPRTTNYQLPSRTPSMSYTGGYIPNPHSPTPYGAGNRRYSQGPALFKQQSQFPPPSQPGAPIAMELPGDFYYPPQQGTSPSRTPTNRDSFASNTSRPLSYTSDSTFGVKSPNAYQQNFAAELPTMNESREEQQQQYDDEHPGLRKLRHYSQPPPDVHPALRKDSAGAEEEKQYAYNPQDYANIHQQRPPRYSR